MVSLRIMNTTHAHLYSSGGLGPAYLNKIVFRMLSNFYIDRRTMRQTNTIKTQQKQSRNLNVAFRARAD